jgi:5'-3' exoribonuclease 2
MNNMQMPSMNMNNMQMPSMNMNNMQMPSMNMNNMQMPNMNNIHMSNSRDAPEIRAPENVQEILARIKNIQQQNNINSVNTTETQDEVSSNNDRLLSDTTISTSDNKKRGRKPMNKKPIISVST